FADPFSNVISQDTINPQYAARVAGGKLTPPVIEWAVRHGIDTIYSRPYIDYFMIQQDNATEPPVVVNTTPNVVPNVTANSWALRTDHTELFSAVTNGPQFGDGVRLDDTFSFEAGNTAGPI